MSAEPKPAATVEAPAPPAAQPAPAPAANIPAVAPPPKAPLVAGAQVSPIVPTDIEQIFRLAGAIAAAGWAPKSYMVDPKDPNAGFDKNKILVGIMQGAEVGLTPMAALQSIAVINGMPSLWGDGALAVVRKSGLVVDIKEEVVFDEKGGPEYATCTILRAGQPTPIVRQFTRAQAQKAGLWSKAGPWVNYPQRMLQMRARAWAMRDGFADILRGLGIAEEVQDIPRDVTAQGSHTTTPEPRRADFAQQGGGYDPAEATPARPTVIDAEDESAQSTTGSAESAAQPAGDAATAASEASAAAEEQPGWPLYSEHGDETGEYDVEPWLKAYDKGLPRAKPAQKQYEENNLPTAKKIAADPTTSEELKKQLGNRFGPAVW